MVHTSKPGALFAVRVQRTDDSDRGHNPETADQGSQKKDAVAETQKIVCIHDTTHQMSWQQHAFILDQQLFSDLA